MERVKELYRKVVALLSGKKTYIVAVLIGVVEVCYQLGVDVPSWLGPVLLACGLGAVRDALKKRDI